MAGLETPDGLSGMSLLGAIYGRGLSYKREYAYSEALYYSRMIRSDRYKYIMDFKPQGSKDYQPPNLHSHQILREILYDMQQHDADRVNLSERKEYKRILVQHREMLAGIESELNQITLPEGLGRETLFHRLQKYVNSFSN
jgi:arylsulfatase A-like enzyme